MNWCRVTELCTRDSLMIILNSKELSNLGIGQRTKQKINASYPHPSFHPSLEECGKWQTLHPHYSFPFLCPTHSQAHSYERTGICKPVNASFVYRLFPKHAGTCRLFKMSAVQPRAWVAASDKVIGTFSFTIASAPQQEAAHLPVGEGTVTYRKRGLRYIQRQSREENKATARRVLKAELCTGAEKLRERECRGDLPATISILLKSVILSDCVVHYYFRQFNK